MILKIVQFQILIILVVFCSHAIAETSSLLNPSADTTTDSLSVDGIKQEIDRLRTNQQLTNETKIKLIGLYETALQKKQETQSYTAQASLYEKMMATAPVQLEALQKKIDLANNPNQSVRAEQFSDFSVMELEQQLSSQQTHRQELNTQLKHLENQLLQQSNRPENIRLELDAAANKLTLIQAELTQVRAAASFSPDLKAHQTALHTSEQALMAETHKLKLELKASAPRVQLLQAQSDWLTTERNHTQNQVEAIQAELERKKESEAKGLQTSLNQALHTAVDKHPIIQSTLSDNIELGNELGEINVRIERAKSYTDELNRQLKEVQQAFNKTKKKQSSTGLSPAQGALLRKQRWGLHKSSSFRLLSEVLPDKTADISLKQYQIEEKIRLMDDTDTILKQSLALNVDLSMPKLQRQNIKSELATLLKQQQTLLIKINQAYTDYLEFLDKQSFYKKKLTETTQHYASFLDEHLLWVSSAPPIGLYLFNDFMAATQWLSSPSHWKESLQLVYQSFLLNPLRWASLFFVISILILAKPYFCKKLAMHSATVARPLDDRFVYTLQSLMYIVLLSIPFALFLYCLGWLLQSNAINIEFSRSVGFGLCEAAIPLFLAMSPLSVEF